jgi:small subunit ribosomal protein S4
MIIKAKYKIARRLGPEIFDKTQSQKFSIATARKLQRQVKTIKHPRTKTEYGAQMLEKQKIRFMYGVNERQLSRYVKMSGHAQGVSPAQKLFELVEMRLDNLIYRLGLLPSRRAARQAVVHGHITVNGRRVTIPSFSVSIGDAVTVRAGSLEKVLFKEVPEKLKAPVPAWIKVLPEKKAWEVVGVPKYAPGETTLDLASVIDFYSR